ncbi:hypothetical protein Vi05172_g9781 [Venturia inaequalis]|nr:hypothetical protein Vi05172_g9781 [Venturia inaequalis]
MLLINSSVQNDKFSPTGLRGVSHKPLPTHSRTRTKKASTSSRADE